MGRKSKYTEEKIIGAVKELDAGAKGEDVARRLGVALKTLYNWRQRYGGMEVSEAKRLRQLEDENTRLKKLLAEQVLDNAALKAVLAKKW